MNFKQSTPTYITNNKQLIIDNKYLIVDSSDSQKTNVTKERLKGRINIINNITCHIITSQSKAISITINTAKPSEGDTVSRRTYCYCLMAIELPLFIVTSMASRGSIDRLWHQT